MGSVESIPAEDLKEMFESGPTMYENCTCRLADYCPFYYLFIVIIIVIAVIMNSHDTLDQHALHIRHMSTRAPPPPRSHMWRRESRACVQHSHSLQRGQL